jgi:hypothetical protein
VGGSSIGLPLPTTSSNAEKSILFAPPV